MDVLEDIRKLEKFVIEHSESGELLFGERLFDRVTDAKNAFIQRTKCLENSYRGVRFADQKEYKIVKLTYVVISEEGI